VISDFRHKVNNIFDLLGIDWYVATDVSERLISPLLKASKKICWRLEPWSWA